MVYNIIDKRQHITTKCVSFKWKLDGCVESHCLCVCARVCVCVYVCTRSFAQLFVSNFIFPSIHKLLVFFTVLFKIAMAIWLHWLCFSTIKHTYRHTKEKVEHAHTFSLKILSCVEDKDDNFLAIQNKNGNLKKEPTSEKWLYRIMYTVHKHILYCVAMVFDSTWWYSFCLFPNRGVCLFCR